MSNIVVDPESPTSATEAPTTNVTGTTEAVAEAPVSHETTAETDASVIPDKFAGKSTEEIIASYQNLEKEMGRKAQEVGELRKLSDSFLQAELARDKQPNPQQSSQIQTEDDGMEFFDDPSQAVNQLIEKHPKFQEFQKFQAQQSQAAAKTQLEQSHPDFADVVNNGDFQEWVNGSPIRKQLFQAADDYNYDAANELLSTWKDRALINKTQEVNQAAEEDRQSKLKSATTEARSASGSSSGKQFRRADLIRMKVENPSQYESMQDEIYQAYSEGRVT